VNELKEARKILADYQSRFISKQNLSDTGPTPDRPQVVAFAMIVAVQGHFPDLVDSSDRFLIQALREHILRFEADRFYKQRRIAIVRILETLQKSAHLEST
jgi:hypothetical protein